MCLCRPKEDGGPLHGETNRWRCFSAGDHEEKPRVRGLPFTLGEGWRDHAV